ncbi:MAG: hypothetical protein DRH17_14055, partial [Deltaproteobacteria bacterium]
MIFMQRWERLYALAVISIILAAAYSAGFLTPQNLKILLGRISPYAFYNDAQATNWWDVDNYAVPDYSWRGPPLEKYYATDGGYKTAGYGTESSGGTYNDTSANDGNCFWVERYYEGSDSNAYTEAWIWVNITDISKYSVKVVWDFSYSGGTLEKDISIYVYYSDGTKDLETPAFDTTGSYTIPDTGKVIDSIGFQIRLKSDAILVENTFYSTARIDLDYAIATLPEDPASVTHDTKYLGYIAGATSKTAGYWPLYGSYTEIYGFWLNTTFAKTWTGFDSITVSFTPSEETSLDNTIADFCFFIYMVPSSSVVSILQIKIRYQFSTLSIVYMVQRASTESLEIDVSGSEYYARLYTSIFPRWVGLKDFDNLQLMDIIKEAGGSVDASQESLQRIDIEVTVNKGSSTDPATIITVWDWFGAWEPASEIQYLSMQVNYRVQSGGLDKLGVLALPTINYNPDAYKYVYFFYDQRYPPIGISSSGWDTIGLDKDWDGDGNFDAWDIVYYIYSEVASTLSDFYIFSLADADEIRTIMSSRTDVIVVFIHAGLPNTVYDDNDNSIIEQFIDGGGMVITTNYYTIGYGVSRSDGTYYCAGSDGDDKILDANVFSSRWRGDWYGVHFINRTNLGNFIGYGGAGWGLANNFDLDLYEQNIGKDYILLETAKYVVYNNDDEPQGEYTHGIGWFKIGKGWVLNWGYVVNRWTIEDVIDTIIHGLLIAPKGEYAYSYEYYNPDFINGDVLCVDRWEDTVMPEEETDESGTNGWGENFADISEFSCSYGTSFTTDGDVGNWTVTGDG